MTTATLQQANDALRHAVETRLATGSYDEFVDSVRTDTECLPENKTAEVLQHSPRGPSAAEVLERFSPPEPRRFYGHSAEAHPTSQAFFDLCDQLKATHAGKSKDYGCPSGTDPLANIRNGAKFVGIPAWRAAMVRLSDKVTRLATFNATGSLRYEGVEDTLVDLASYALLSLLLYKEENEK